jgi:outer membrane receptor protein involved in Fe transport
MRLQLFAASVLVSAGAVAPSLGQSSGGASPQVPADAAATASTANPTSAEAPEVSPGEEGPQEIVVTGTRIQRAGFTEPTPVTTLGADQLKEAAPGNLADAVLQLPQLHATNGAAQSSGGSAGGGQAFINLRSLGIQRTLVLLDGRRFVPSGSNGVAGAVDISLFPSALVQRVDIVTGGASAAYGSDAVSGVVNFVLNKRFTGLEGEIQGGETKYGDDQDVKGSLAFGTAFADGRGHFLASAEGYRSDGISSISARSWAVQGWDRIPNGTTPNSFIVTPNTRASNEAYTGLITSGLAKGTTFDQAGNPVAFNYGNAVSSQYMAGGDGVNPGSLPSLVGSLNRKVGFARLSWDLNDNWTAAIEGNYGDVLNGYQSGPNSLAPALSIKPDNAFIPAAVKAVTGNTPFSLGKYDRELGNLTVSNQSITKRGVLSLDGTIGTWHTGVYYEYGQTVQNVQNMNDLIQPNYVAATDAVVGPSGNIVCRSSSSNPGNGCIAYNPFGERTPTADQLHYLVGTSSYVAKSEENVASLNISGEPVSDWAGPVSLAGGAEYRRESLVQTSDPLSQEFNSVTGTYGVFRVGNFKPSAGSVNDKEGYVETVVPLLKDLPGAKSLEFNGAFRYTDYNLSGGVETWKAGLTYQPLEEVRFRATRSRDIRAPSLDVLYINGAQAKITTTDPTEIGPITQVQVGNPNLQPEVAYTTTFGIVYQPQWATGLSMSVDAYDIAVNNAITTLTAQQEVNFCLAGNQTYCALEIHSGAGNLTTLDLVSVNLNSLKTRGLDLEGDYNRSLSVINDHLKGDVSLRLLASYVDRLLTCASSSACVNNAGDVSELNINGVPHWRGTLQAGYNLDAWNIFVQERFVGGGKYFGTPALYAQTVNPPDIGGVFYTDLTISYKFREAAPNLGVYFNVSNLFNRTPPIDPYPTTLPSVTNPTLYDTIGQMFHLGFNFKF